MIDTAAIRKVWGLLTVGERRGAVVLLALMVVGMVFETLGIGLVIPAIGLLTQPDFASGFPALQRLVGGASSPGSPALIAGAMLGLLAIYLLKTLFLSFLAWRQAGYAFQLQARMSQSLFALYLRQPYPFHLQRNSAELIRNAVNEMNVFTFNVAVPIMTLAAEALVLPGVCILLLAVEPLGTFIVVTVMGVVAWAYYSLAHRRIAAWGIARQQHEGLRIQHLQQGLGGAKDVKLLGRESEFLDQYAMHNAQSALVGQRQWTVQQLPRLFLELLAVGGLSVLVLVMLARGRDPVAILPVLGLFAAAAFRLLPSVNRVLTSLQALRYGLAAVNTLHKELHLPLPAAAVQRTAARTVCETLELVRVTYTYPGAPSPAIRNLSLTIRRGEAIGFIGGSGAGKSTLVDVLLGLLEPDSGEVRADGKNILHSLRGWQDQIGYVPQSIFLTDDSLRRNVAFGLAASQIDERAVLRAIRAAQLEEFVQSLPQGLDTTVGERGVRLSGGQRQRIGIARALYHDPATLVLDEASSSLDYETEREVMQAVRALQGTKTIIIVAHRLSTVEHCDRLYRLEGGRLVETGAPSTMLTTPASTRLGMQR